jgi:hypothetical protein
VKSLKSEKMGVGHGTMPVQSVQDGENGWPQRCLQRCFF